MPGTLNVGGHDIITHSGTAGAGDVTVNVQNRLVLDSSGNVGIGTSSPNATLEIGGTATPTIRLQESGAGAKRLELSIDDTSVGRIKANQSGGALAFDTLGTERMRIDSSGNLLVGTIVVTPNPGAVIFPYGGISLGNNAGSSGFEFATFRRSGVQIGSITQSGTTGVTYATSSDYRLKENITEITDGINRVKQLNPSRFNFISDPDIIVDGFIAHEVSDIVPEAVCGEKDALNEDGSIDPQGIDQSKLIPLLTAALQEAISKIEALTTRIEALENA